MDYTFHHNHNADDIERFLNDAPSFSQILTFKLTDITDNYPVTRNKKDESLLKSCTGDLFQQKADH